MLELIQLKIPAQPLIQNPAGVTDNSPGQVRVCERPSWVKGLWHRPLSAFALLILNLR